MYIHTHTFAGLTFCAADPLVDVQSVVAPLQAELHVHTSTHNRATAAFTYRPSDAPENSVLCTSWVVYSRIDLYTRHYHLFPTTAFPKK